MEHVKQVGQLSPGRLHYPGARVGRLLIRRLGSHSMARLGRRLASDDPGCPGFSPHGLTSCQMAQVRLLRRDIKVLLSCCSCLSGRAPVQQLLLLPWAVFARHVQCFTVWPALHVQSLNGCFPEKWGEHVGNSHFHSFHTCTFVSTVSTLVPRPHNVHHWWAMCRQFACARSQSPKATTRLFFLRLHSSSWLLGFCNDQSSFDITHFYCLRMVLASTLQVSIIPVTIGDNLT